MPSMQRSEVFFLVHRLLPGFELQTSVASKQQMKTPAKQQLPTFRQNRLDVPANQRTQANRLPSTGVSYSNVQHNRLLHRRIGVHRRIDYHQSAYQIPTFNTTDRYTGESAYTDESIIINRRIRFQRSTQQIGTPAKRRTGDRRPASRRIRFQRSTKQIGTPGKRRPASRRIRFQRSTQQIGTPVKRRTGDRRPATGESPYQLPTLTSTKQIDAYWTNFKALNATVFQPLAANGNSRGRPSLHPTRRVRRPLGLNNFQNCMSQLKMSSPFIVKKVAGFCRQRTARYTSGQ